jgi:hypothetical protein
MAVYTGWTDMISVVCVYNDERTFKNVLLRSLERQTVEFQLIKVNNVSRIYKSASEALNWGATKASGEYIMFIHQDVELPTSSWLQEIELVISQLPHLGICGVAGMSETPKGPSGRLRGAKPSQKATWEWYDPVNEPEEVQTLDEGVLIMPKSVFSKLKFDEKNFDGWHCYGADYCLAVKLLGFKAFVLPTFVYHRSVASSLIESDLFQYQVRLYNKYNKVYRKIYTTCGEISSLQIGLRRFIRVWMPIYGRLFPNWYTILARQLRGCSTLLDLGCGFNSPTQYCGAFFSVGVDEYEPYLHESRRRGIHSQYLQGDIRKVEFKPKSFDAVIGIGILDRLTMEEGSELLEKMQTWARKRIVVTALNGQKEYSNSESVIERSSGYHWSAKELKSLQFAVFGTCGWKRLRTLDGSLKNKPEFLWALVSSLTQKIAYSFPLISYQLLAVKKIDCDREGSKPEPSSTETLRFSPPDSLGTERNFPRVKPDTLRHQ